MKEVFVNVHFGWTTSLEVPDDFEVTRESIQELIDKERKDFDFGDGGMDIIDIYCEVDGKDFKVD